MKLSIDGALLLLAIVDGDIDRSLAALTLVTNLGDTSTFFSSSTDRNRVSFEHSNI